MEATRTQHTPGPWRLESGISERGHFVTVGDGIDDEIARTHDGGKSPGEEIANARLIAAAPDLLAALEAIAWIPCDHGPGPLCQREIARAAIAAAAGQQAG